jgi:hypothetical protein
LPAAQHSATPHHEQSTRPSQSTHSMSERRGAKSPTPCMAHSCCGVNHVESPALIRFPR